MEKKLKIIIAIAVVVIVAVVGVVVFMGGNKIQQTVKTEKTYTETLADVCIIDLQSRLKDPSSLQVNGSYTYRKNGEIEYIVIDAGAKNSFGGVTRSYFVYTDRCSYVGTDNDKEVIEILNDKTYDVVSTSVGEEEYEQQQEKIKEIENEAERLLNKINGGNADH